MACCVSLAMQGGIREQQCPRVLRSCRCRNRRGRPVSVIEQFWKSRRRWNGREVLRPTAAGFIGDEKLFSGRLLMVPVMRRTVRAVVQSC
jgi:hypothetical protein